MKIAESKRIETKAKALFNKGMRKKDIFDQLKIEMPEKKHWVLAAMVAGNLKDDVIGSNRLYNILLIFLFSADLLAFSFGFSPAPVKSYHTIDYLNMALFLPIVISAGYKIYKYDLLIIVAAQYFCFVSMIAICIQALLLNKTSIFLWLLLPTSTAFIILNFLAAVFPEVNIWGRVKKDINGSYIFNE